MPAKRLVLLRHAKSSWAHADMADHDRPLNARGRRAATLVGQHLKQVGLQPDVVLCSSAARTCQTLELLDLTADVEVLVEDQLYGAKAGALLARLRTLHPAATSVLVIGHNPGIEDLARMLVDDSAGLGDKFPTAAMADLQLPIRTWEELAFGKARLHAFVVPRDLA